MPAAPDFHLNVVFASANDGCLDMRFLEGCEDKEGFRSCGLVEKEVSNVILQYSRVRGIVWGVNCCGDEL